MKWRLVSLAAMSASAGRFFALGRWELGLLAAFTATVTLLSVNADMRSESVRTRYRKVR